MHVLDTLSPELKRHVKATLTDSLGQEVRVIGSKGIVTSGYTYLFIDSDRHLIQQAYDEGSLHGMMVKCAELLKQIQPYSNPFEDGAPAVVNSRGGKQSSIVRGWTNIPADALEEVAGCLFHGELKYNRNNWRSISHRDHVEHAIRHVHKYAQDGAREDLVCATARLLFALSVEGDCDEPFEG